MKPFKKRKIYTEPTTCLEEKLATTVYDSKALLFPYDENQGSENVSQLVKTLTKGIDGHQGPVLWRKVALLTFYARKSLKPEHQRDPSLNTLINTDLIQKYFECLLKSSTNSDIVNYGTLVSLLFQNHPENLFNFILSCDTPMTTSDETRIRGHLLLKLASMVPISHVDDLPSYTRVILAFQKILHVTSFDSKLNATLEDTLLQHLPEQIPFACDDEFKLLLTDICPDSDLTKDILSSPFREENCTKFMQIQR